MVTHNPISAIDVFPLPARRRQTAGAALTRFLRRNPLAVLGLALILLIVLTSALAPLITPYKPTRLDILHKLSPPSLLHPLGGDFFGRDILSRILYGGRNTLRIGLLVIALAFSIGVPVGILAGFTGGLLDNVLMRIVDAILSFPALVLAIMLAAALGPSLENAMLAVVITMIPQFARVARGQALAVRAMPYIEAARSIGVPNVWIMWRYVLPNALGPLIVQASLSLGSAILVTASLGFLGLGAQPPTPEWGVDVSTGVEYLRGSPWVAIFPGLAILVSVIAFNLLGDSLVDWMNPRTRKAE